MPSILESKKQVTYGWTTFELNSYTTLQILVSLGDATLIEWQQELRLSIGKTATSCFTQFVNGRYA